MKSQESPVEAKDSSVRLESETSSRRTSLDERDSKQNDDLYSAHDFDINIDLTVLEPTNGMNNVNDSSCYAPLLYNSLTACIVYSIWCLCSLWLVCRSGVEC